MLVKKPKRGPFRIAMGPRALTASSGLAPWSMAVDLGSVEKNPTALGGRGHLAISTPVKKREGISA